MPSRAAAKHSDAIGARAPTVGEVTTLDDVAARLGAWRHQAGSPTYSAIVRRVGELRETRGFPAAHAPGRITVYDCFKPGRRRIDIDLVVDIGRVLGLGERDSKEWERTCWAIQHRVDASRVVTVRTALPELVPNFVGREASLQLMSASAGRLGVFAITGMPGSGKTQLATRVAQGALDRGEVDQVVFADLRGFDPDRPPADPGAVFEAIARALGDGQRSLPAPADRAVVLGELLATQRAVVILDDARGVDQVDGLVPERDDVLVLVTSRTVPFDHPSAVPVPVGMLTDDEAVALLLSAHGRADTERPETETRADAATARRLAAAVGHLPLALNIVASRIAARPKWTLADHEEALTTQYEQLRVDESVRAAFDVSYRSRPDPVRRALRLIAAQPCTSLGRDSLAALVGADVADADLIAGDLFGSHMAECPSAGRVGLHALVRAHATVASFDEDRPADRDRAIADLCDHLIAAAWAATQAIYSDSDLEQRYPTTSSCAAPDADAAVRWLEVERENLLTISDPTHHETRPTAAIELSEALGHHFDRAGLHHDALIVHDRALAAARGLGDERGEGRAELHIGQTMVQLSDLERGAQHLVRAERLLTSANDHEPAMAANNALAIVEVLTGDLDGALRRFQAVLAVARTLAMTGRETTVLDNIAIVLRRIGDLDGAVRHHRLAYASAVGHGYHEQAATTLTNLSEVHLLRGRAAEAFEVANQALDIARQRNFLPLEACAASNVGLALGALGRADEGTSFHERALACARETGRRHLELSILNDLGHNGIRTGDLDAAAAWLDLSGRLADELGDHFEKARGLDGLGQVANQRGDVDGARRCWAAALSRFETLGAPEAAAVRLALDAMPTTTEPIGNAN